MQSSLIAVFALFLVVVSAGGLPNQDANFGILANKAAGALVSGLRRQDNLYINGFHYNWNASEYNSTIEQHVALTFTEDGSFFYPSIGAFFTGHEQLKNGFFILRNYNAGERRTWDAPELTVSCENLFNCEVQGTFIATARPKNPFTNQLSGELTEISAFAVAQVKRSSVLEDFKIYKLTVENTYRFVKYIGVVNSTYVSPSLVWAPAVQGSDVLSP